jgi:hypothetical protein
MRSKHLFLTLGMSLSLMSACIAQPPSSEGGTSSSDTIRPPPLINQPLPQTTGPLQGESAQKPAVSSNTTMPPPAESQPSPTPPVQPPQKTAPDPAVQKSPPRASMGEAVPRPPVDEEETQPAENQPRPQPCEGMAANAVSPRVQDFLTCKMIQILAKPDMVQSFRVKPDPDPSVPEDQRLGNYPIVPNGEGAKPSAEQLKELQSILFSEKSYVFGAEKRCFFRPEMGLHFTKGREAVEMLFSFECDLWLFVHKGEEKLEDFDPARKPLKELRKSLFPTL